MSGERAAGLIHNARNRLAAVMARLGEEEATAVQAVCGHLASAIALLRLDDPAAAIRRQEVDLELFFSDLKSEAAALAPPHLRTEASADFAACPFGYWTFDSQLIRLVLIDALMNAWRHGRQAVRLDVRCREGELIFTVLDDGPGFPAAWLAADTKGRTPAPRGTGEGLHLARRIAEMHSTGQGQGRVELSNAGSGGGASFSLILP